MEKKIDKYRDQIMYLWIFNLTLIAGCINAVGLMQFSLPITYVSGKIAQMAVNSTLGKWDIFIVYFILIACFFLGSLFSGIVFSKQKFQLRLRYGLLLIGYAMIITAASFVFRERNIMAYILAFIVGSQNGFFLYWKGAIVRTAHMTGYLSDAGVIYGRALRGNKLNLWKAFFYTINIMMFFIGGLLGAYIIMHHIEWIYKVISLLYIAAALVFFYLRSLHKNESRHFYK